MRSSRLSAHGAAQPDFNCLTPLFIPEPQCRPVERPRSGQTESVLRREPQCVRLGPCHHTPRTLKLWPPPPPEDASRDDGEDDEEKVKVLSLSWGCQAFLPPLSGLGGCRLEPPPLPPPTLPWITLRKG